MYTNRFPAKKPENLKKTKLYLLGIAVLFFSALSLSTCKQTDLFSEYRGTNLLDGISFTTWVPDQTGPYMNYEQVSGTGYEPPSDLPGEEVYRLEIKNLIPNGDFEATTAGAAPLGWTAYNGGGTVTLDVIDSGSGQIYGKTMHFAMDNAASRVYLNLRDVSYGSADGFKADASYLIHFDYKTKNSIIFEYNTGTVDQYTTRWKGGGGINGSLSNPSITNTINFPASEIEGAFPDITANMDNQYYSFGSLEQGQVQEGYVDNFRLIRTDLSYKLRLHLNYADDTVEPLISGYYRFSIYVKEDPSVGTIYNRFASDRVCIGITGGGVSSDGTGFDESSFSNYTQYYNGQDGQDWSAWTKISVDLALQIPNSSSRAMELSICPTDDSKGSLNMDVGSILISSPSLEMFPDGFP